MMSWPFVLQQKRWREQHRCLLCCVVAKRKRKKSLREGAYHNPSLGLATKARGCKVVGQEEAESHVACSRECKKMWGNGLSHSQGNSHMRS
jgi:hypothetical protein